MNIALGFILIFVTALLVGRELGRRETAASIAKILANSAQKKERTNQEDEEPDN